MMKKRIIAVFLCCVTLAACLSPVRVLAKPSPEVLLNGAKLSPMKTNYQPLDDLVQQTFDRIFTPGMSVYEKTKACFSYLSKNSTYAINDITSELYHSISKTVQYQSNLDSNVVCEAFGMLTNKIGTCNNFAASFMVMTRAIGLESYIQTCVANGLISGTKDHYFVIIQLQGKFYAFDARMGLLRNNAGNDGFDFFCTSISSVTDAPCDIEECTAEFGSFRTTNNKTYFHPDEVNGATEGDRHFNFGSYPQSLVEDETLTKTLTGLTTDASFTSFRYSSGKGEIGTQARWDYMWYADVTYKGERYRGIKFSNYRPIYLYYSPTKEFSYQDDNGFETNTVYWFRFEPIEWRLIDGNNLFVADYAIDAQPFQTAEYYNKTGKTFNGIVCHYFGDAANTYPANDWEHSFLRKWLNDDFFNTAFTDEEKKMIVPSVIDNTGYGDRYSCNDTEDRVWLLSYYELQKSEYIFCTDVSSRDTQATDYALAQGVCVWDDDNHSGLVPWRLRSAGFHADDTCYVIPQRLLHYHMDTMGTMAGIRPALRISEPVRLCSTNPEKPKYITAKATGTNEITVRCSVVNGAENYRFYCYSDDGNTCLETYNSEKPIITVTGLTAGKTYIFRSTATVTINGSETETPLSDKVSVLCRCFVIAPLFPAAESLSTGMITLSWDSVVGADHYIIYQYTDKTTQIPVAQSNTCSASVSGLTSGLAYYFTVTAVSADGFESMHSSIVSTICTSYPSKPQDATGQPTATGEITLTWTPSEDAQYYQIYRYTGKDTTKLLGATVGSSFTVTGLYSGVTYYFYIVAVTDNGKSISASSSIVVVQSETLQQPVPTQTPNATAILGDIDGDWIVTSADARLALRLSVGLESFAIGSLQYLAGDADGDGKVTSADARLILRTSVGLEILVGSVIIP